MSKVASNPRARNVVRAPQRAISGELRGKVFRDPEALWTATLGYCREEFRRRFGREWNPDIVVQTNDDLESERRARKEWRRLRDAMRSASAFVEALPSAFRRRPLTPTERLLAWWVPVHLAPLLQHACMEADVGPLHHDSRAEFVGRGYFSNCDARDLTIISLLGGHRPDTITARLVRKEGCTVAKAIRAEEKLICAHVAHRKSVQRRG